jgi:hypothetical protein
MKRHILVILLITILLNSKAQNLKEITIRRLSDTTKIINLHDRLFFDLVIDSDSINNNENIFFYEGYISNVSKDSIYIYSETFTERIIRNNDVKKERSLDHLIYDSIETLPIVPLCKKNIYYIEKNNNKARGFYMTMGFVSLFSGLVVAPLISVNYKNGDFREKMYYYTASISVAISILNFSLLSTSTHKYWFKNYNKKKKKWYIE